MDAMPKYKIGTLDAAAAGQQWVTLVSCGTVVEADLVRSRLESEGVAVLIPDEHLMTNAGWGLNAYGYVRLQVSPKDYENARALLCESGDAVAI